MRASPSLVLPFACTHPGAGANGLISIFQENSIMDLQAIIIGLVAVALCVLPILYLQIKRKQEKDVLLNSFLLIAAKQQVSVSDYALWDPFFAIAIDQQHKRLLYLSDITDPLRMVQVDLKTVATCIVEKVSSQVNGNLIIESIALHLRHRDGAKPRESTLLFYQKEMSLNLSGELQLAEKWKRIIDANLQAEKVAVPAQGAKPRTPVLAS